MFRNQVLYHGMGYQIRDQEILISQIKADYKAVQKKWEQVQNQTADIAEIEKILQTIAWVKTGLGELKDLQSGSIETTSWGEINKIEDEMIRIQNKIRIRIKEVLTDK